MPELKIDKVDSSYNLSKFSQTSVAGFDDIHSIFQWPSEQAMHLNNHTGAQEPQIDECKKHCEKCVHDCDCGGTKD